MSDMKKHLIKEIEQIQNEEIKNLVSNIFDIVPNDFWVKPASSTEKYHPPTSNTYGSIARDVPGGLVMHTKQVFYIAKTIVKTGFYKVNEDVIMAAALLHDSFKYSGRSHYTSRYHAVDAYNEIKRYVTNISMFIGEEPEWYANLLNCVLAHNGRFTTEYDWNKNLAIATQEMIIVHTADWIAAQTFNEFNIKRLQQ